MSKIIRWRKTSGIDLWPSHASTHIYMCTCLFMSTYYPHEHIHPKIADTHTSKTKSNMQTVFKPEKEAETIAYWVRNNSFCGSAVSC